MPTDTRADGARAPRPSGGAAAPRPAAAPGRALAAVLALLLCAAPAVAVRADDTPAGAASAGAANDAAALKIEEGLMCYCGCTDLTVRVCNCGVAAGIKSDIRERLAAGQSPAAVIDAYVARYGAQIRSAPTRRGFDLLAWWMPFVVVFAAGGVLVSLLRRWGRRPVPAPSAGVPGPRPDASALDRVDRAVREIL